MDSLDIDPKFLYNENRRFGRVPFLEHLPYLLQALPCVRPVFYLWLYLHRISMGKLIEEMESEYFWT
jgi:hypothetical protein